MSSSNSTPIACVLEAIPDEKREQHHYLAKQFQNAIETATELENGFRFGLMNHPDVIRNVAEWMAWERFCCPFFHFNLEVENDNVSLSLTGGEGVKDFIESQLPVLLGD